MKTKKHFIAIIILALAAFAAHADMTMLIFAAEDKDADEARRLIAAGADIEAKNSNGWTALMYAAWKNSSDITKLLLAAGADVNARTKEGEPALMYAKAAGNKELAKMLEAPALPIAPLAVGGAVLAALLVAIILATKKRKGGKD